MIRMLVVALFVLAGCSSNATNKNSQAASQGDDLVRCFGMLEISEMEFALKKTIDQERNALFYLYADWSIGSLDQFLRISEDARFKWEFSSHDCYLVNVTAESYLADYLNLLGPPSFLYFKNGVRVDGVLVGISSNNEFYNWLSGVR